jgi:hypothetical protein
MAYIPPYLLIWPIDNAVSGLFTDLILVILGVVLGIIGMDREWGHKAWIPFGIFSLNVTVLIVLAAYIRPYNIPEHIALNRPSMAMAYTIPWLFIVIQELLVVVPGIIGMGRGWGYKVWIPLGVFSLIITVTIVVDAYNRPYMVTGYITIWLILVILELLGLVFGIIGIKRGWRHKAWIPLVVLSVPIDLIFLFAITAEAAGAGSQTRPVCSVRPHHLVQQPHPLSYRSEEDLPGACDCRCRRRHRFQPLIALLASYNPLLYSVHAHRQLHQHRLE